MLEIAGLPDRFKLKEKLGSGGMAVVYLAHDSKLGHDIALKKLQIEVATNFQNAFERFRREFELLSSLSHPNLIKTYELLFTAQQEPFVTMEYVKGASLSQVIRAGTLSYEEKLDLTLQLAQAMAYIHSEGIIHRDIKPSNVIVQEANQIKLLDFGLSRYIEQENLLTVSRELIGSPEYIAPEQIHRTFQKDPPDHRVDIYSFGITVFQLFTGQVPFFYPLSWHIFAAHLKEEPPKLRERDSTLPPWLEKMVSVCLRKNSQQRYQSMDDVVELIEDKRQSSKFSNLSPRLKGYQKAHIKDSVRETNSSFTKKLVRLLFSFLVAFGASTLWLVIPAGTILDQKQLRASFGLRGPVDPPEELLVVGIDDTSLRELDLSLRQPLPRRYFAKALEQIVAAQPRLVILDLAGFRETDDEEANLRIEQALRGPVPVTILKGFLLEDGESAYSDPRFREAAAMELPMLVQLNAGTVWRLGLPADSDADPEADHSNLFPLLAPLKQFAGTTTAPPDPRALINYYGPPMHIPRYSLYHFINDVENGVLEQLKDRIVFVGFQNSSSQSRGLVDIHREEFAVTASSEPMYGVEIHATIAGNLIDQSWIERADPSTEQLVILLAIAIILFAFLSLSLLWGAVFAVLALLAWALTSYLTLLHLSFFIPGALFSSFVLIFVLGPLAIYRSIASKREVKELQEAFGVVEVERK